MVLIMQKLQSQDVFTALLATIVITLLIVLHTPSDQLVTIAQKELQEHQVLLINTSAQQEHTVLKLNYPKPLNVLHVIQANTA